MPKNDLCGNCISYWLAENERPPCKITGWCPVYKEKAEKIAEK